MDDPAPRRVEILVAEDNPADVRLLQEGLKAATRSYHVSVVSDGEAVEVFLTRRAPYTDAPPPDLILLDIQLPKKSGWQILEWVRATPAFATIPVVMWTGVLSPADEEECARLQPTRCLVKPTGVEKYRAVGQVLEEVIQKSRARGLRPYGDIRTSSARSVERSHGESLGSGLSRATRHRGTDPRGS